MKNRDKISIYANAVIVSAAVIVYILLISPFNVMAASARIGGPVYKTESRSELSLLICLSWEASALDEITDELSRSDIKAVFAVTGEWARLDPKALSSIARSGHEIALLDNEADWGSDSLSDRIRSDLDSIERITGDRPEFIVACASRSGALYYAASENGLKLIVPTIDLLTESGTGFEIRDRLQSCIAPGEFIAASPTRAFADTLPFLIEKIKNMGLRIVSIHKMLYN